MRPLPYIALKDLLISCIPIEKRGLFVQEFDALLQRRDTSDVWRQLAIWLLVDEKHGVIHLTVPGSDAHNAIKNIAQLYIDECNDLELFENAASDAYDIGEDAGGDFYAVNAAWHAADAMDGYVSTIAAVEAWADEFSRVVASTAMDATNHVAMVSAYETLADKLIELMKQAPEEARHHAPLPK